jgi:hypothetical protein
MIDTPQQITLEEYLKYFGNTSVYAALCDAPDNNLTQEESKRLKTMLFSDDSETVELAKELINTICI